MSVKIIIREKLFQLLDTESIEIGQVLDFL